LARLGFTFYACFQNKHLTSDTIMIIKLEQELLIDYFFLKVVSSVERLCLNLKNLEIRILYYLRSK